VEIDQIKALIRDVPDFPEPGVVFKDITPVLADPIAFSTIVDLIVVHFGRGNVDKVVGIEARGFILAAPVAYHFGAGISPVRKKGKPPSETIGQEYALEYGTASLEIHKDAVRPDERVLVVDDVLATGGTALGEISIRSRLASSAMSIASRVLTTPTISPFSSISRTCGALISPLTRGPSRVGALCWAGLAMASFSFV